MTRRRLPQRRRSETRNLSFRNRPLTISIGFYPSGEVGEVFTDVCRSGEDLAAIARDASILMSLALQFGASTATLKHALTRDGAGEPASILGAIIDALPTTTFLPKGGAR